MDKKQYRSLVVWVAVLSVCVLAGYCLLALLYRDRTGILLVMTILVIAVLVAMIRSVRKLGATILDEEKKENDKKG